MTLPIQPPIQDPQGSRFGRRLDDALTTGVAAGADTADTTVTDPTLAQIFADVTGSTLDDATTVTEETPGFVHLQVEGNWTSRFPGQFNGIVEQLQSMWGTGISKTEWKPWVNRAAVAYTDDFGSDPTGGQLLGSSQLNQQATIFLSGAYLLPTVYRAENTWWYNDPLRGPQPADFLDIPQVTTDDPNEAEFWARAQGIATGNAPRYTTQQFTDLLQRLSPLTPGGGGGGGRGGTGRAPIAFDKAALQEGAAKLWRSIMLEEPPNPDELVDGYVKAANSFWLRKAGRLDFNTFIRNKARETARWHMLYDRKPEHLAEEEWIGGFTQATRQVGLPERLAVPTIERGAASGAGAAGFAERISRSRPVVAANQGGFSQRLAATAAGLGALMQS